MKSFSTGLLAIAQLVLGTILLAIVLRTWLVMGLIEPVTVAGSSMAPTLLGPHVSVQCDRCQHRFDVGADFAVESEDAECPQCGFQNNPLGGLPLMRGDRLVIDRTALLFRRPQRWEPVVFVSPEDERSLVVKRVVGLPGETIQLRDGEILIDGKLAGKSLATQSTLRRLVHLETTATKRWRGDGWTWNAHAWNCGAKSRWHWLSYVNPTDKPITDDSAYNAGLTRRLFVVNDLCLSSKIKIAGDGELAFRMNLGTQNFEFLLNTTSGELRLSSERNLLSRKKLSHQKVKHLQSNGVRVDFSFCDRKLQFIVDGFVEIEHKGTVVKNNSRPLFSVGARNVTVSLKDLRIFRDAYFASHEEMLGLDEPMSPIALGDREIFVLGDNVPVSLDSRHWGPLPLRFLVGRPIGVR